MSLKAGLIAAGFSAHLGIPIKSEEEAERIVAQATERCPICGKIGCSYISRSSVSTTDLFDYNSIRITNRSRYTVRPFGQEEGIERDVDPNSTVADIKQAIASQNQVQANESSDIVVQYGGRKLDDDKTPKEQGVPLGGTLISSRSYWYGNGPHPVYYIKNDDLEPEKDFDFTKVERTSSSCERGGYEYQRPIGWDRCALKVKGKYENDIWLGEDGWRDKSTTGEWAVSYHGTEMANIGSIAEDGYKTNKSKRQAYGPGIYSTPSVEVAAGYAVKFPYKENNYKMVLQNRVNLQETKEVPISTHGDDAAYFVTADENNVRPYGVCLKCLDAPATQATQNTDNWSCLLM